MNRAFAGRLAFSLLTPILYALSFASIGSVGLGWLAWVALVPWLVVLSDERTPRPLLISWLTGLGLFLLGLYWLVYVTVLGYLALGLFLSLYALLFGFLVRRLGRRWRWPLAVIVPVAWVTVEWLRSLYVEGILFTGFPWLLLGHTQYERTMLIQVAALGGAYAVSFIVAAFNGLVADVWSRRRLAPVSLVCGLGPLLLGLVYGAIVQPRVEITPGPQVLIVQANIPQELKHAQTAESDQKMLEAHLELSALGERPELIIWPETMTPVGLNNITWGTGLREAMSRLARRNQCPLLVGGVALEEIGGKLIGFNSAFWVPAYWDAKSRLRRYDKIRFVPFGEYIPWPALFSFLRPIVPYADQEFKAGTKREIFELGAARLGVLICYEDVFPDLARATVGAGANVLVNLTNDGWFGDSYELEQHLAALVFRAVEYRVGAVRAANTGISCVIDPAGRIIRTLSRDGRRRCLRGALTARLAVGAGRSVYADWGDVAAWVCVAMTVLGLSLACIRAKGTKAIPKG